MAFSLLNSYTALDTASGASLSGGVTLTNAVSAGDILVVAHGKNAGTGNNVGMSSITNAGAGNTWSLNVAGSVRANSLEVGLSVLFVTNAISAGTTLGITYNSTGNRKTVVVAHCRGLSSPVNANSAAVTIQGGETSQNANGSGSFETVSTTGATTVADTVTFAAMSMTSQNSLTPTGGATLINQIQSAVGSSDRGVSLQYLVNSTTGTKTSTATQGASGVWASANLVIPITISNLLPSDVIVTGSKKAVVGGTVIVGGSKKTIASVKVIVGGVKKSVV